MTRSEIEQLIHRAYEARRREDVDAVMACFATDGTFRISANERLGDLAVTLRGHEELRACWIEQFATWDWVDFPIVKLVIDDGPCPAHVVAHSQGQIVHAPSGKRFDFETLDMLTVEGGLITSFVEFFDTDMAAQILGGAQAR